MSADRISRLVFWVGGVILPSITSTSLRILASDRAEDIDLRLAVLDLDRLLWTGGICPEEFCHRAIALTSATITTDKLFATLPEHVEPLSGMPLLVAELAAQRRLTMVSDYPRRWLLPVVERSRLSQWFPDEAVFYCAEHQVSGEYTELFATLVNMNIIVPGSSLWVDHHPKRSHVAVRQGIDVAIFVDARRLRRDLGLWGLMTFDG